MIASILANPYVSMFGYVIGVISGSIAIVQAFNISKKNKEIKRLNVDIINMTNELNLQVSNKNKVNQGDKSQYFQDNSGPVNIDNRG